MMKHRRAQQRVMAKRRLRAVVLIQRRFREHVRATREMQRKLCARRRRVAGEFVAALIHTAVSARAKHLKALRQLQVLGRFKKEAAAHSIQKAWRQYLEIGRLGVLQQQHQSEEQRHKLEEARTQRDLNAWLQRVKERFQDEALEQEALRAQLRSVTPVRVGHERFAPSELRWPQPERPPADESMLDSEARLLDASLLPSHILDSLKSLGETRVCYYEALSPGGT